MTPQPIPPTAAKPSTGEAGRPASFAAPPLPAAGDVHIDDKLTFEVELASYQQMHELAGRMVSSIQGKLPDGSHLFFVDDALRAGMDLRETIETQLRHLAESYARAEASASPPPPPRRPTAAESLGPRTSESIAPDSVSMAVSAAVSLLGALRTDTRYSGRQVLIPEQAFALALAHYLEPTGTRFHYPTLFAAPSAAPAAEMQRFIMLMDRVTERRAAAAGAMARLLAEVSAIPANDPTFPMKKVRLDLARDAFQSAEAVFEGIMARLAKADEKTGLTQLQLIQRAALVQSIPASDDGGAMFFLFAQVVSSGGAFRITTNLWSRLFGRDGLEHAGGCMLTFALFDRTGQLLTSNTIGQRSPYAESRPAIKVGFA